LLGDHQLENSATAYAALQTAHARGLPLDRSALLAGLAQVEWPGRFEVLNTSPPLVVDSAHNRDSAQKLCAALDDYFPGRSIILVFGASHDKDIDGMLDELLPRAAQVVFTRSYHPRAIEPLELAEHVGNYEGPVHVVPAIEDALERGLSLVDKDEIVLVTGSLFTVAGARDTWYNHLKARYRES
jgi:dihydrofolate synthase/folylpolyglutamate synthase